MLTTIGKKTFIYQSCSSCFMGAHLCGLPASLTEAKEMRGFCVARDPDDQPSSFYRLPMGDTPYNILRDINDCSSPSGMQLKKVSKLLPYSGGV